jgi:hypothetical protein
MSGTAVWGVGGLDFMPFSPQERRRSVVVLRKVCSSELNDASAWDWEWMLRREGVFSFLQVLVFPCVGVERASSLYDRILSRVG